MNRFKPAAAVAALLAASSALAGPAVTNTNLKIIGLAGEAEVASSSDSAWATMAALTAPLGEKWGVQLEAGAAGFGGDSGFGAAAHLFRRDPDKYLAGAFVSHASIDDADLSATRFGAEGELYFDKITLLAAIGYQTSDDLGDTAFGGAEIRLYVSDDFTIAAGAAAMEDAAYGRISTEWRFAPEALPGVALRAEAALGDNDYSAVMGGLTVYLGESATLKDRHRQQDPDSALFNHFQGIQSQSGGAEVPQIIQCIDLCNVNS